MSVMAKANSLPDLVPFEPPRFHDRLELLHLEPAWQPVGLLATLARMAQSSLTPVFMLVVLARFYPGIVLPLAMPAELSVLAQR
jgi:ATP-binding cassette, subfamily B, bacterial